MKPKQSKERELFLRAMDQISQLDTRTEQDLRLMADARLAGWKEPQRTAKRATLA